MNGSDGELGVPPGPDAVKRQVVIALAVAAVPLACNLALCLFLWAAGLSTAAGAIPRWCDVLFAPVLVTAAFGSIVVGALGAVLCARCLRVLGRTAAPSSYRCACQVGLVLNTLIGGCWLVPAVIAQFLPMSD